MITGYFLCTSQHRSIGKPIGLLLQISIYSCLVYLVLSAFKVYPFSIRSIIGCCIPSNWFITLYIVIYLISPCINIALGKLSNRGWKVLISILLILFSGIPMILGCIENIGINLSGLSTSGRGGNQAGYTLVNFVVLYCIGACIRKNELDKKIKHSKSFIVIIISALVLWGWRFIPMNIKPWHMAGWYDNILVILLAASALIFFKRLKFRSSFVNYIAKSAFTVYIIHIPLFLLVSPKDVLQLPMLQMLCTIVIIICCIYVIAIVMYKLYEFFCIKTIKYLDKYSIEYFD